jgi:hypothetical protein
MNNAYDCCRAFFKWQQTILLNKFLSPYKHSTSLGREDGNVEYYDTLATTIRDHTEHIVSNSIARSERKLLCKHSLSIY